MAIHSHIVVRLGLDEFEIQFMLLYETTFFSLERVSVSELC
jgi:hypothetical protein